MKFGDTQVALECKERGELLGVLWDHFWSVVDVRAGLEAEERLAELHTKYVALVGSNSGLEQDVKVRCSRVMNLKVVAGSGRQVVTSLVPVLYFPPTLSWAKHRHCARRPPPTARLPARGHRCLNQ